MLRNLPSIFAVLLALTLGSFAGEPPAPKTASAEQREARPFSVTVTGSGRPMILIPGLSCAGNVWDGTVAHFKDHYECHVVTLAGFAGQPGMGAPYLPQVRDGLLQYIRDKHLDHPIVIGHSLGGFMAFSLGATAPEEIGPIVAVDGMPFFPALLDPTATAESAAPQAEFMRSMLKAQAPAQFALGTLAFLKGQVTDPKNLEKVAEGCVKSDPGTVAQALYELLTTDLRPKVAAIRAPVLVLGATAEVPIGEPRKQMEERYRAQVETISRHKVVFAPRARHFIQLDEPEFFLREVDAFLQEAK